MRILLCHNYYQQPGGEDRVFADEAALLREAGHDLATFVVHNDAIRARGLLGLACDTIWNRRIAKELSAQIARQRSEVVHFHNTFPLISPAAYYAARRTGAAVVQTLHNYRLLCPAAVLYREGKVCQACVHACTPWPSVVHACYRGSRLATTAAAGMLTVHRLLGTWQRTVDRYIALSQFAKEQFVAGGLPAERIAVKPNFVHPDPGKGTGQGGYALFIGRLAAEKGLDTLIAAWSHGRPPLPLKILGDGPLADVVAAAARNNPNIEWLGARPPEEVLPILGDAACLIMPSQWFEGFPKVLVEAYAKGTPVIASRLGSLAELVEDGRTGRLFAPGDAADLAKQVCRVLGDANELSAYRGAARANYEARYTATANYEGLLQIYREALQRARLNGRRTNSSASGEASAPSAGPGEISTSNFLPLSIHAQLARGQNA